MSIVKILTTEVLHKNWINYYLQIRDQESNLAIVSKQIKCLRKILTKEVKLYIMKTNAILEDKEQIIE